MITTIILMMAFSPIIDPVYHHECIIEDKIKIVCNERIVRIK